MPELPPSSPQLPRRTDFVVLQKMETRWADNDAYGHVNNVVYYEFFDSAVNRHLIEHGALQIGSSPVIGLVVESQCKYFSSIGFPDAVTVGLRVAHLGNSSVRYEIAIFRNADDTASALGHFVHVYVDRASNRPTPIPDGTRAVLAALMPPTEAPH